MNWSKWKRNISSNLYLTSNNPIFSIFLNWSKFKRKRFLRSSRRRCRRRSYKSTSICTSLRLGLGCLFVSIMSLSLVHFLNQLIINLKIKWQFWKFLQERIRFLMLSFLLFLFFCLSLLNFLFLYAFLFFIFFHSLSLLLIIYLCIFFIFFFANILSSFSLGNIFFLFLLTNSLFF